VFDILETELVVLRYGSVCGEVKVSDNVRSDKLVYCGDVSLIPYLFIKAADIRLVVFG